MAVTVSQEPLLERFAAAANEVTAPIQDQALMDWGANAKLPLLLAGRAGSGRAQALCRFAARRAAADEAVVLLHAGLTIPSAEPSWLLWQLLMQLRALAGIAQPPPQTEGAMREALPNWLARAAANGPLWLLIADIDALADLDGSISLLPEYWPPNLHVAASALPGACAQHLINAGWQPCHMDQDLDTTTLVQSNVQMLAAELDSSTVATVGGLLALVRVPVEVSLLAAVSGETPATVIQALTILQPLLLQSDGQTSALAHPLYRQALVKRCLPDEGPQQQLLEALAAHAEPLLTAAYYRQAWRPDRALDTLLLPGTIMAANTPERRMQWLAEWGALHAGEIVPALAPTSGSTDARLLLAAVALVEAAGESIPAGWLTIAATTQTPELCARARVRQAQVAIESGDWAAATQYAEVALDLAPDANILASARHELARAAEGAGNLELATALYQQALEQQQAKHGQHAAALLPALGNLIGVLRAAHRLTKAERLAQDAARIARENHGPMHPATAMTCDQIAAIAYAGTDYAAAEAAYRETLEIVEAAFGPKHTAVAAALHNLGTTLDARRAFVEAEACYRRALAIREAAHGREHEDTAATLHNLAAVLDTVGRAEEAERLYRETTDIWERLYGAEHAATLTSLTNLAGVLASRAAYADAEVCYRAAIEGWRRVVGDKHPNTLTTLAELGRLYADGDKAELAEPLLEHVVETSRSILGVGDAHHINSVCALSALWRDQGRRDDARNLLNQTLIGAERKLGLLAAPVQQLRNQLDTLRGDILH